MNPHDDLLQILGAAKEEPCFYLKLAIVARKATGLPACIRSLQLRNDGSWSEPIGCKTLGIEHDPHLSRLATDNCGLRNVVQLLQGIFQLTGYAAQSVRVILLSPQR